jgi:hypothetical protein
LVFDQFEEIFSLGQATEAQPARCETLIAELAWLIEGIVPPALTERFEVGQADPAEFNFRGGGFRGVLSFREDFLPDFEDLKDRIRSLFHNRLRLTWFNQEQAIEVVRAAGAAGDLFAPDMPAKIVNSSRAAPRARGYVDTRWSPRC